MLEVNLILSEVKKWFRLIIGENVMIYIGGLKNCIELKEVKIYIPLKLNYRDLNQLEKDIRNKNLPKPIFEKRDIDDKLDLEFIEKARQAINDGYAVYYNSWW